MNDEIEKLKTDHDIACCAYLCASDTLDDAYKHLDATIETAHLADIAYNEYEEKD